MECGSLNTRKGISDMGRQATNAEIIETLEKTAGNVSLAARQLGIARCTIYLRIKKNSKLTEAIEQFREKAIDDAESALQRAVLNGEGWAVCFTLKTIGKSRGYIEKQQVEHSGGMGVVLIDDIPKT